MLAKSGRLPHKTIAKTGKFSQHGEIGIVQLLCRPAPSAPVHPSRRPGSPDAGPSTTADHRRQQGLPGLRRTCSVAWITSWRTVEHRGAPWRRDGIHDGVCRSGPRRLKLPSKARECMAVGRSTEPSLLQRLPRLELHSCPVPACWHPGRSGHWVTSNDQSLASSHVEVRPANPTPRSQGTSACPRLLHACLTPARRDIDVSLSKPRLPNIH